MKNTATYIEELNRLLASYQIHYQNLRSLHWNIKGKDFFELHVKYEELYTRTLVIVDDLAERILSIGETPQSTFSSYLVTSPINELEMTHDGATGVAYILSAQQELLKQERSLLHVTGDADDEGTNALMSDLIREKEKTNWMFKAWLNK
ncbi:MAG: DNA starvation/stationary phase protection protein [Crocinitomicaceae bacterium]|nr:DNA starvation/stationary phase protection protein [Flavobacteriales bacterium]NQZ37479.1 DNA starvation/stationary phase protection protein [Crocinitomicaceae bacterium]